MPTSHNTRSFYLENPVAGLLSAADVRRFWAKVQIGGADECWDWTGCRLTRKSCQYGQFGVQAPGATGRQITLRAHRVAYTLSHGQIPDGAHVLHHCDNSGCCNPAHLYLGTHKRNMEDAAERGRLHVSRPGRHVITDAQVDEMVALVRSGARQCDVAERFGVSKTFVCLLLKGQRRQYRKVA